MIPYFEINIEPDADYFLWALPVLFSFAILAKFPAVSDIATSFIKISRNWLLIIFGLLISIALFGTYSTYQQHIYIKGLIDTGKFSVVSGCIQNYRLDKIKRNTATFEIEGIEFSYNNYERTPFFYEKEFSGKVMKNGSCLEISYLPIAKKNGIIKIVQLTIK